MKICFFGDAKSIHIQRWCAHFINLGHQVSLISFSDYNIENVSSYYINAGNIQEKGGNWKVLLNFRKVKKILNEIKPDIFHAMYATSYGITGALCGFRPYIITTLGSDILISPKKSIIYRILLRFAFSRSTWITAMAEHMRNEIINLGISKDKVSTIPFGIDPNLFFENDTVKSDTTFKIISTRNFELIYNIPLLLEAISEIKEQIPNFELILIGAGSLKDDFQQKIRNLGIEKQTVFLGKLTQIEIAKHLNDSHVFVSVSLSDGNNISLNEAMACGSFCIASNIPANQQWISDNENGFLVPIDDSKVLAKKILFAYNNYDFLQSKALPLNRKLIKDNAIWSTNMKKVELKYDELIENGKK